MIFTESPLPGAFLVDLAPIADERGFFARAYCDEEFAAKGLGVGLRQCSVSYNTRKGTLRGLHYQRPAHEEHKLVRCTAGAIFDVIVDIRPQSSHYRRWYGTQLTAQNRRAVYVPESFAHGLQTLEDNTEVFYQISEFYKPDKAAGLRFDDPKLGIQWPLPVAAMSEKDSGWKLLP